MQDLIAGHIDFSFSLGATSLPQVRTGTIKAFAVNLPSGECRKRRAANTTGE
jgi:tripartite-type tricarboxylate transporter receptor subunit TctC